MLVYSRTGLCEGVLLFRYVQYMAPPKKIPSSFVVFG